MSTPYVEPNKKELIHNLLDEVSIKKRIYLKKMCKFKKIEDLSEATLIASGAIAVSNLFVTVASINPITLIIGATFSSISTIGTAIKRVLDIKGKYESCRTTYQQFADLERETKAVLAKNHLQDIDLENILNDIIHRISLIEDTAIPITISMTRQT